MNELYPIETVRTRSRSRVWAFLFIIAATPLKKYPHSSFPPGVLNCVPSLGPVGGAALAEHHDVDKVCRCCASAVYMRIDGYPF